MRAYKANISALAIGLSNCSAAKAENLFGKTIQATYSSKICDADGVKCFGGDRAPFSVNVYISPKGTIFDYVSNAQGVMMQNGGRAADGTVVTVRGNTYKLETTDTVRRFTMSTIFTAHGDTCSIDMKSTIPGSKWIINTRYCKVIEGHVER